MTAPGPTTADGVEIVEGGYVWELSAYGIHRLCAIHGNWINIKAGCFPYPVYSSKLAALQARAAELEGELARVRAEIAKEATQPQNDAAAKIVALRAAGLTQSAIAEEINRQGIPAPRGGRWHTTTVARVLARVDGEIAGEGGDAS